MTITRLPMFPLSSVLLPTGTMPLHIFEPRYRQLVRDCLAADTPEFGVVLIERGKETGGGEQRHDVATVAQIVECGMFEDGRYALLNVGTRRIHVTRWLEDDPYPLAEVEDWPDTDEEVDAETLADVFSTVRRVIALAIELGEVDADLDVELSEDSLVASYQLAAMAPIGPADAYNALSASGASARIAILREALADREAALQFRLLDP